MYFLTESSCGWIPAETVNFIAKIIDIIKILTPVILVIMGSIEFAKAVMSQNDSQIKNAQSAFLKKIIAGVAVFFIIVIIQWVTDLLNNADETTGAKNAFACLSSILNGEYSQDNTSYYDGPETTKTTTTTTTTKKACYCKTLEEYIQDYSYISNNPQAQRKLAQEAYDNCIKECDEDYGHSGGDFDGDDGHSSGSF